MLGESERRPVQASALDEIYELRGDALIARLLDQRKQCPAFSEAAALFLRNNAEGQKHLRRLAGRHGKAKALSILAAKLGRAVYLILSKERAFDMGRFLAQSS